MDAVLMQNAIDRQSYHITFDIDWAPDSSIAMCLDILDETGVKATFFATHETDLNQEILFRGHALGIHPNFLPGSSHGSSTEEVVESCLRWAPNATLMRTHALVQSTPMFLKIFSTFPQITLDMSLLTMGSRFIERSRWRAYDIAFDRINYNWEDDIAFFDEAFSWEEYYGTGDLMIFDFHPIHVHLNSSRIQHYNALKARCSGRPLFAAPASVLSELVRPGSGARQFLRSVIHSDARAISLEDIL